MAEISVPGRRYVRAPGQLGINPASGYARAANLIGQANSGTASALAELTNMAFQRGAEQSELQAAADAQATELQRDANGMLTLPELQSDWTIYGKRYNEAIRQRYVDNLTIDSQKTLAEYATKNFINPQGFERDAGQWLKGMVERVDPSVRGAFGAGAQRLINQHYGSILDNKTRRDIADGEAAATERFRMGMSDIGLYLNNGDTDSAFKIANAAIEDILNHPTMSLDNKMTAINKQKLSVLAAYYTNFALSKDARGRARFSVDDLVYMRNQLRSGEMPNALADTPFVPRKPGDPFTFNTLTPEDMIALGNTLDQTISDLNTGKTKNTALEQARAEVARNQIAAAGGATNPANMTKAQRDAYEPDFMAQLQAQLAPVIDSRSDEFNTGQVTENEYADAAFAVANKTGYLPPSFAKRFENYMFRVADGTSSPENTFNNNTGDFDQVFGVIYKLWTEGGGRGRQIIEGAFEGLPGYSTAMEFLRSYKADPSDVVGKIAVAQKVVAARNANPDTVDAAYDAAINSLNLSKGLTGNEALRNRADMIRYLIKENIPEFSEDFYKSPGGTFDWLGTQISGAADLATWVYTGTLSDRNPLFSMLDTGRSGVANEAWRNAWEAAFASALLIDGVDPEQAAARATNQIKRNWGFSRMSVNQANVGSPGDRRIVQYPFEVVYPMPQRKGILGTAADAASGLWDYALENNWASETVRLQALEYMKAYNNNPANAGRRFDFGAWNLKLGKDIQLLAIPPREAGAKPTYDIVLTKAGEVHRLGPAQLEGVYQKILKDVNEYNNNYDEDVQRAKKARSQFELITPASANELTLTDEERAQIASRSFIDDPMLASYSKGRNAFLAEKEGFASSAYDDAGGKSVGFGFHMDAEGALDRFIAATGLTQSDFEAIKRGAKSISLEQGIALMQESVAEAERTVDAALKKAGIAIGDIVDTQRTALVSLAYNGGQALLGPRLMGALAEGDYQGVIDEILYNSGAQRLSALIGRRYDEAKLFASVVEAQIPSLSEVKDNLARVTRSLTDRAGVAFENIQQAVGDATSRMVSMASQAGAAGEVISAVARDIANSVKENTPDLAQKLLNAPTTYLTNPLIPENVKAASIFLTQYGLEQLGLEQKNFTINENFFGSGSQRVIRSLIEEARSQGRDYVTYEDYDALFGNVVGSRDNGLTVSAVVGSVSRNQRHAAEQRAADNQKAADILGKSRFMALTNLSLSSVYNPPLIVALTLGGFKFKDTGDGFKISDPYDFGPALPKPKNKPESGYKDVRRAMPTGFAPFTFAFTVPREMRS